MHRVFGLTPLRQTQGDKKVPQIIEFVGLVCLLSGIVRLVQRRERLIYLYFQLFATITKHTH